MLGQKAKSLRLPPPTPIPRSPAFPTFLAPSFSHIYLSSGDLMIKQAYGWARIVYLKSGAERVSVEDQPRAGRCEKCEI